MMKTAINGFNGKLLPKAVVMLCIGLASLFLTIADSQAQSRICRQLEREMSSVSAPRGTSSQYRKYDNAIREQSVQINRTRKLAQRNRCSARGFFRNRSSQCERIMSSLGRMEANLDSLKAQRERHAPQQYGSNRDRRRIQVLMERHGCYGNQGYEPREARQEPRRSRRRTLLEQIFGVRTYDERGSQVYLDSEPYEYGRFGGTFRTLCVRESDGYYFPISFSTRSEFFDRDQETCQAMCPGTTVNLYFHRMPGEDSEQMIELGTEQPYSTKPFAFQYRKKLDTENNCRFATAEIPSDIDYNANSNEPANQKPVSRIAIPVFRKDPLLSPDDYDNQIADLGADKVLNYLKAARNPTPQSGEIVASDGARKNVRIVGPAFFPVQ
ncbi:MAG: DUF2865 domain-containing protein [Rhizobiaceae bacterium]|nr:DUF2865 domain-containing protein [Rhizobiaceae bacterium]